MNNTHTITECGDESIISSLGIADTNAKDKAGSSNDIISPRSKSNAHIDESPPKNATEKCVEETSPEVPISTSLPTKTTDVTSGSQKLTPRNPITGLGLGDDGQKFRRNTNRRDGNPVTGEGYKPAGAEINTAINQAINKNRIPPGGFSSGLW